MYSQKLAQQKFGNVISKTIRGTNNRNFSVYHHVSSLYKTTGQKLCLSKLHKHSPWIIYTDSTSSFYELLSKDYYFTIHHRNIQRLPIELYKRKENLSNEKMNWIFSRWILKYNVSTQTDFFRSSVSSTKYGLNSL